MITLLSIHMRWCDQRESLQFQPHGMIIPMSILFRFTSITWTLATCMNDTCAVCPVLVVNLDKHCRKTDNRHRGILRYGPHFSLLHMTHTHYRVATNKLPIFPLALSNHWLGLINCSILSVDAHLWPQPTTYIDENDRYCKLVCTIVLMENL